MADGHVAAGRAPRFAGPDRPRMDSHGDSLLDSHGAGKDAKDSKPQNHFSAIPALVKRSIKGCVPRICHLKVTKIDALSQLTSSKTYLKLVVVMRDGRSRIRDSARHMRVTRAALSSSLIPIQASESFSLPLNMHFFIQYFHNMKAASDSIRILLQKGKKRPLVNKTIAECTISLADILQNPLEDGSTIILHSTGRLKRAQPSVSAPLLRVHAQLESISLDLAEVGKWWPEDDVHASTSETLLEKDQEEKDQGIFSPSEDDDAGSEFEGRSDDDEWVETCESVLAVDDELGNDGLEEGNTRFREMLSGATIDMEKEKFGKVFRSKVLSGTRKIASITLNPVRAVRNGYARIRSGAKGLRGGEGNDGEGGGEPSALDWSTDEEEGYGDEGEDGGGAWESLQMLSGGGEDQQEDALDDTDLVAQLEAVLALSGKGRAGAAGGLLVLVNDTTRRGQKVRDWVVANAEAAEQETKEQIQGTSAGKIPLWSYCVPVSSRREVRLALRMAVAARTTERGRSAGLHKPFRVGLLGSDTFVHGVVQEYVGMSDLQTRGWEADPPLRFYPVPVGKRGRDVGLAQQLSARDEEYGRLFFAQERWHDALDAQEDGVDESVATDMVLRLEQYLHRAAETLRFDIAEVYITCTEGTHNPSPTHTNAALSASSPPTGSPFAGGTIVQQHSLPFVSSLLFRPPPEQDAPTPQGFGAAKKEREEAAAPMLELNLDFWVCVGPGEYTKTSSYGAHSEILVRRSGEVGSKAAGSASAAPPMILQALTCRTFKEKSKRVRSGMSVVASGNGSCVKAGINKLICCAKSKSPNFTVVVDGIKWTQVRFVSVSPILSSSLVKSFPIATFAPSR